MEMHKKFHKIRALRGHAQKYVAAQMGISQEYYSELELGKHKISDTMLEKFAAAMEMPIENVHNFNEDIVFSNHNQQGGNANVCFLQQCNEKMSAAYEEIIRLLKAENERLRLELARVQSPN